MSTKIIVDYRRDDQRRYIYQPYWISSAECLALDIGSDETKIAIMFSFPAAKYGSSLILIHQIVTQIVEGFTAGTITFNSYVRPDVDIDDALTFAGNVCTETISFPVKVSGQSINVDAKGVVEFVTTLRLTGDGTITSI